VKQVSMQVHLERQKPAFPIPFHLSLNDFVPKSGILSCVNKIPDCSSNLYKGDGLCT